MRACPEQAIKAHGARNCIALDACKGKFSAVVSCMLRACLPSDSPQNRWKEDTPRLFNFDLSKRGVADAYVDELADRVDITPLEKAGGKKAGGKKETWQMAEGDFTRCLELLSAHLQEDEEEEAGPTQDTVGPGRQLTYAKTFERLKLEAFEWGSFSNKQLLTARGATSHVYSAAQKVGTIIGPGLRPVALKTFTNMAPLATEFPDFVQREVALLHECSGLNGVVTMYGITFNDNEKVPRNLTLVCELKSTNLAEQIEKAGEGGDALWKSWGEATCVSVLRQIVDAMLLLHSRTPMVIHRDLKPSNVLLSVDESHTPLAVEVFICDFGLAKETSQQEVTMSKSAIGTPAYRAPELDTTEVRNATFHVDVFSWGMVALHMVVGGSSAHLQNKAKDTPIQWGSLKGDCCELFNNALAETAAVRPSFMVIQRNMQEIEAKRARNTNDRGDIEVIRQRNSRRAETDPRKQRPSIVYRVLDVTDRAQEGLRAGNPRSCEISHHQHVEHTSVSRRSSYISVTQDPDWALWCFSKEKFTHCNQAWPGPEIVAIDLDKLHESCNVYDVSSPTNSHMRKASSKGKSYGESASEVLLQPTDPMPIIPPDAIVGLYRIKDMPTSQTHTLFRRLEMGKCNKGEKKKGATPKGAAGAAGAASTAKVEYLPFKEWSEKIAPRLYGRMSCYEVLEKCKVPFEPQVPVVVRLIRYEDGPAVFLGNAASRAEQSWAEKYGGVQAILQVRPTGVGCNLLPVVCTAEVKVLSLLGPEATIDPGALKGGLAPKDFYQVGNDGLCSEAVEEASKWIDDQLNQGRNVLIHSTHAHKRAAAFAILQRMKLAGATFDDARDRVAKVLAKPLTGQSCEMPLMPSVESDVSWRKTMIQLRKLEVKQLPAAPSPAVTSPHAASSVAPPGCSSSVDAAGSVRSSPALLDAPAAKRMKLGEHAGEVPKNVVPALNPAALVPAPDPAPARHLGSDSDATDDDAVKPPPAKKAKKAKKDPNAPKGATSAWMFFQAGSRERIKSEQGDLLERIKSEQGKDKANQEIPKIAGKEWQEMGDEAKKKWEEMALADKQRTRSKEAPTHPS